MAKSLFITKVFEETKFYFAIFLSFSNFIILSYISLFIYSHIFWRDCTSKLELCENLILVGIVI